MKGIKEQKVKEFRDWAIENDLIFVELVYGHFQIFKEDNTLVFQVWSTTEKMKVQADDSYVLGMPKIKSTILKEIQGKQVDASSLVITYVSEVRQKFLEVYESNKGNMFDCILVVAVYLPTGATEIITNHYEVQNKMEYYLKAYDDEFKLKTNPAVRVTGFMLV